MKKHNLGDKVKVIDELSFFFGEEGVVDQFREDLHHNVWVRFSDNRRCGFRHKELEPRG